VHGLSPAGKGKTGASGKKRKDDALKKFVATKITRVDADDAVITKDDMYQAFTRWCRDHRYATVPERKAFATLLKNKFAITEKTVNGTPCWANVHLR
jgi:phage/plasmid-associated DNA primase